jgi:hypothetical protein
LLFSNILVNNSNNNNILIAIKIRLQNADYSGPVQTQNEYNKIPLIYYCCCITIAVIIIIIIIRILVNDDIDR